LMAETNTRRQSVNFLGFLRSQLSGLQGIPTLCYELIQNADDVKDEQGNPGTSRISFDVCDDALYVENDGVFREIDFTRMENVSWGNKREEAGTTGAFGIGFISVYQVTDSPEIFSSGLHWRFQPDAAENERILETKVETHLTQFRLPWAFETSNVRQELRIPPVDPSELEGFVRFISQAIEAACLFLKQVTVLELRRSGNLVRRIETLKEGNTMLLSDGNGEIVWRILEGRFEQTAASMRARYGALIEEKRQPTVKIALPETPLENGLLYAFLPSETHTGLPFHINADFYPSQDRKRILFEQNYQSEWNNLAIRCAATTLAENVDGILDTLPPQSFWDFAERVKRASDSSNLSEAFTNFWRELKPRIREKPAILTTWEERKIPPATFYLDYDEQVNAAKIFENLGIGTVHPDLRGHRNLLIETGVNLLWIEDVAGALRRSGFVERIELQSLPGSLSTKEGWQILWAAMNNLWGRASISDQFAAKDLLEDCAIAFGSDGALWPPGQLFQADSATQELFTKISSMIWYVPHRDNTPLPAFLVPDFDVREGVRLIQSVQTSLPALWAEGNYDPQKVYEWLERYRDEIANDYDLKNEVRSLSIWPTADGTLKPLNQLYLAGDFDDPLNLAQLVDVESLGGRREFLETTLDVSRLDFLTYVRDWVPQVLATRQLDKSSRFRLLKVLAENLGKLQGQADLQKRLTDLPLVWCGEEVFDSGRKVYFDSKIVRKVIGKQGRIAKLPPENPEAVRAFYDWLGVVEEPRPGDVIARIRAVVSTPPQPESLKIIETIFEYLAERWIHWDDNIQSKYIPLQSETWLGGTKRLDTWFKPFEVSAIYQRYLFESQGNFLKIDTRIQRQGSELIRFLGVQREPTTAQVVSHLLYCSQKGEAGTQEIYVYLSRNVHDPAILQLKNKACLYLKLSSGIERYFRPDQVFWEQHPFGDYRYRLGAEFGQFKELFDLLGVKSQATAQDAIQVLLEIADEFGRTHVSLVDREDVEDTAIRCWRLLSEALEDGEIDAKTIKTKLEKQNTIPDARHLLEPPRYLFFGDRPGWGAKFEVLQNSLTPRIEGAWLAMEAAGVQRLSKAIQTQMHQCVNRQEDQEMALRLRERRPLVRRVIEEHRSKGVKDFDLESVDGLTYAKAEQIEVVRVFTGFRKEESTLEDVDAVHLDGTIYFVAENGHRPWKGIAREIAYVLHPSGELSSLGMELKEILSQSFKEAAATLDEYMYPRIEDAPGEAPEGQTVQPGDKEVEDTGVLPGGEEPGDKKTTSGQTSTGHQPVQGGGQPKDKPEPKKPVKRKTTRLLSYVNPGDETTEGTEKPEAAARRTEIGQLGVDLVMKFENDAGRQPTDMETIQVHHPGYDVKSVDKLGQTRYIEVKSFSGTWDSQNPAQLTKTEFETAQELGSSFWLYVVERVESEDAHMIRIQNPAHRADYFLFDHRWMKLAADAETREVFQASEE
jgi:hypothetical protein